MECRSSLDVLAAYVLVLLVLLHTFCSALSTLTNSTIWFHYILLLCGCVQQCAVSLSSTLLELVCFLIAYSFYMHTESDSNYYHYYVLAYLSYLHFLSLYLSENTLCETMEKERFRKRNHDNRSL